MNIKIGTRKSKLAMVQTELVRDAILEKFPNMEIEIIPMSTKGDEILDRSLSTFGGKGVFTKELEDALLQGSIDLAVHSAKDMPMEFPEGLGIGAILERANPGDVLLTKSGILAKDMAPGSVIGTSSLRREIQIKNINPQLKIKLLRGNVQTRIQKLVDGEYDGILLAAAGLERLGIEQMDGIHQEQLEKETFVPAPGQGILAIETRVGDLAEVMAALNSESATEMLQAEREFMRLLDAGCNAPCGAYCRRENGNLVMTAMFAAGGLRGIYHREQGTNPIDLAREVARKVKQQPVSLVGAGPGDVGLFTRKGLACVQNADVIIYDNLISPSLLNEAKLDAELVYAGKRSNNHHMTQDQINEALVSYGKTGKYVVRLKGGDPYIFGRGGEEALALEANGIPFEIVPGVSSSYSVPAYAGVPVTQRELASSFHVITGHEGSHKETSVLDYATLAKEEGTLIFLMGLKNLPRIVEQLMENGKEKTTPVAVIQQGTTARQRKAIGTLETIVAKVERVGIKTPAITVVGDVVSLEEKLDWFLKKPLSGKRVLVTGTRALVKEMDQQLTELGAETIAISVIESCPIKSENLSSAVKELGAATWMVFTSPNGIEIFFDLLKEAEVDFRKLMHMKFATIGRKTGTALKAQGFMPDFVPTNFSGYNLGKEWIPQLTEDDMVLLFRAKEGAEALPNALTAGNIAFKDIPLYENRTDLRRKEDLIRITKEVDYITFTSGSAVEAFCSMIEDGSELTAKVMSIGPSTTAVAKKRGLQVYASAVEYTADGIVAAILGDK